MNVETKIIDSKHTLFNGTKPEAMYLSSFDDNLDVNDNCLPFGEETSDEKEVDVNDTYIEALNNYIGDHIIIPGRYYISILVKVKVKKENMMELTKLINTSTLCSTLKFMNWNS